MSNVSFRRKSARYMVLISAVFLITVFYYVIGGCYIYKSIDSISPNQYVLIVLSIPLLVPFFIVFRIFSRTCGDYQTQILVTTDGLHIRKRKKMVRYIPKESISCYGVAEFHSRQDPVIFFCTVPQETIYKRFEENRSWAKKLFHFSGYDPAELEKSEEGIWKMAVGVTVYPDQLLENGTVIKCAYSKGMLKQIEALWDTPPVNTGACLLKYNLIDSL